MVLEEYSRGSKKIIFISLFSLAYLLLFKLSVYPPSKLHLEAIPFIVFFGGLIFSRFWQVKNDIAIRLIIIGCVLPFVLFIINYLSDQDLALEFFKFEKLIRLMGFAILGFWLGGKLKNIYIFLIIAFLGLIVALFNVDVIKAFKDIFAGKRVDFDIQNAQHTAMFFGLAVLAFISFYKDLFFSKFSKKGKASLSFLYGGALLIAVIIFIGAQTRASIFAMDVIFVISIIHFGIVFFKNRYKKSILILFLIYFFVSATVLFFATDNALSKRSSETQIVEDLSNGHLNDIPRTSLGIRINTWIEAGKWIKEKPLHGWGGGARKYVIKNSELPYYITKSIGHFHNSYIEFTLAYGLIGLFYVLFIYYWVNRKIYLLANQNAKYKGVWYFTLYGSLFMAMINFFESYLFFRTGVYATAILLAPAYSLYLADLYTKVSDQGVRKHEG